jgi:hypothetical protein
MRSLGSNSVNRKVYIDVVSFWIVDDFFILFVVFVIIDELLL